MPKTSSLAWGYDDDDNDRWTKTHFTPAAHTQYGVMTNSWLRGIKARVVHKKGDVNFISLGVITLS